VAVERISGAGALTCPLCDGGVSRSGCATCHLSMADIQRYGGRSGRWAEPWGRGVWSRFIGLVVYAGLAAWSWYFMPSTFLFVLPGAVVGAYLQVVRARPLFGAVLCAMIVVVVPLLLWSAGLTGVFAGLTGGR
jgi:hypothetical protein